MTTTLAVIQDRASLQAALYEEMKVEGAKRYDAQQESAKARGGGSDTQSGRVTLPLLLPLVAETITETLLSHQGRPGKTPKFVSVLKAMDAHVLAALTIKHGWDGVGKRAPLGKLLIALGQAVEALKIADDLLKADQEAAFAKDHAAFKGWSKTIKRVARNNDTARSRARGLREAAKAGGVELKEWDAATRAHVAEPLINALLATGLFLREDDTEEGSTHTYLTLTELGQELVDNIDENHRHLSPLMLPMVVKPEPWKDFNHGCYADEALHHALPLVRTPDKEHKILMEKAIKDGELEQILKALTAISQVKFALNPAVVDLVEWVGALEARLDPTKSFSSLEIRKFPRLSAVTERPLPKDFASMNPRDKARAVRDIKQTRRVNRGVIANTVLFRSDINTMKRLLEYRSFFLPHNLDFRGRVYPAPSFNHQRADHIKGTFRFARGKRLGPQGWKWLRAALASAGDFEKLSKKRWDERIAWTEAHKAELMAIAQDPQGNALEWLKMSPEERKADVALRWHKADKPFTFYALCLEVAAAWELANPENFISRMPIAFDGSNSGIQHYTAALRAEEGRLVNLTPAKDPADLYATVAEDILQKALRMIETEGNLIQGDPRDLIADYAATAQKWGKAKKKEEEEAPAAKLRDLCAALLWVRNGLSRSHVKRNVMTFGYSSGVFGFKEQILEDHMDALELKRIAGAIPTHPFGDDAGDAAAAWLAKHVWDSVTRILTATHSGMRFFQDCAAALAREGKPMIWRTPLGFPVVHKYQEWDMKEVELFIYDKTIPVHKKAEKDKIASDGTVLKRFRTMVQEKPAGLINKSKQKSAIAPNIIHSMDSTHLFMVVIQALDAGISNFMLIHDSFATHAADCGSMEKEDDGFFWIIRRAFVDLYAGFDLFQSVKDATLQQLSHEGQASFKGILPTHGSLDLDGCRRSWFAFA